MKIIKKTLVVLVLCSFIMGTVPISVLAQENSPDDIQYAPNEIIVKFKEGTSDATISMINSKNKVVSSEKIIKKNPKAIENEKTKILKKHGLDRIYLLKLPKNSDVNKMVSKYNENPDVEYAEPNYKVYVDAIIPDDYYFSLLWGMHNTGQSGGTVDADIDALEAWGITTGSSDIVVAVIDTGVDYNHPDLNDNMWINPGEIAGDDTDNDGNGYVDDIRGWDFYNNDNNPFDDNGHGTHCSGTIAAEGNNEIGVVGVSWNAKIMPLKFLNRRGSGYTDDAIDAIDYATQMGADIMSNSWGGGGDSQSLKDAISTANDAGILFVAAAGNAGTDNDVTDHYPSSYDVDNIISVAATDRYDNLASFSCYGLESVDLGAPGVTIASTYPRNRYAYMSGTSMAAPHVAGAAALIKAQYPDITVDALKAKILDSVDPIGALAGKTVTGGRLNVHNALDDLNTLPIANASGPYSGTEDKLVTFDGSGSYDPDGDKIAYHWDFGDGSTGTGESPTHTYAAGGKYTVTLIVNDGKVNSLPNTTTANIIEVNDPPVADAGPNQTVSIDETVTFNGSGSQDDGTTLSYAWNFGDDSNGTSVSPTHTYAAVGTYTVTLIVTDEGGLTDTDTLIVTVTDEPANTMHIASIDMSLKTAGPNKNGIALVTIIDALGAPVAGATVEGHWSDLTHDIDTDLTDASGEVKLNSDKLRNAPEGTFNFTVDSITLDGWTYDENANIETTDSIPA